MFLVSIIFQDFAKGYYIITRFVHCKDLTVYLCLLGIREEASQDGALPLTWSADCELAADDYTVIAHCSCQDAPQRHWLTTMLFEAAAAAKHTHTHTHTHVHRRREMNIVRLVLNLLGIKGMRLCHVS